MTLQLIKITTEKAAALHSLSDEGLVTFNISHLSLQQGPKNIPVEIFIQKKDGGEFLLATLENPICRQFSCNLSVADSDEVTVSVKCSKGTATVNVIGFSEPEMIEDDYDMMHEDLSLSHDSDDTNDIAIGQSKKKRPFDESITKPEKKNKKSKKVIEKNPSSDSSSSDDDDDEQDGISVSSSDDEDNNSQFIDKEAMEEENISPEDISSSSEVSENEQLNNMVGQDIDLEKTSSGSEDGDSDSDDDDDDDDMISNSQDNSSSNEEVENSKNKQIS